MLLLMSLQKALTLTCMHLMHAHRIKQLVGWSVGLQLSVRASSRAARKMHAHARFIAK